MNRVPPRPIALTDSELSVVMDGVRQDVKVHMEQEGRVQVKNVNIFVKCPYTVNSAY